MEKGHSFLDALKIKCHDGVEKLISYEINIQRRYCFHLLLKLKILLFKTFKEYSALKVNIYAFKYTLANKSIT